MKLRFWGVRGSLPSPGPLTVKYGGNTSCLELRLDDGTLFIFDAGTGIRPLGLELLKNECPLKAHIFLTHAHWDHIQGFPFFEPAYYSGNEIIILGCPRAGKTMRELMADQMEYAHFPVDLSAMKAKIEYFDQLCQGTFSFGQARVVPIPTNHPGTAMGFRIEEGDKKVIYLTDNEIASSHPQATSLDQFAQFCSKADLLIHDATFTPEEISFKRGWGHSSYEEALELALVAPVKRLALFHHHPERRDEEIDKILARCRSLVTQQGSALDCFAAQEGLEVVI